MNGYRLSIEGRWEPVAAAQQLVDNRSWTQRHAGHLAAGILGGAMLIAIVTGGEDVRSGGATLRSGVESGYTSSCDYLLDFDSGHEFVATAFVTNGESSPQAIMVVATFRQAGHDPIVVSRTVTVPAGERSEVSMNRPASTSEIDRIQALPGTEQCDVQVGTP